MARNVISNNGVKKIFNLMKNKLDSITEIDYIHYERTFNDSNNQNSVQINIPNDSNVISKKGSGISIENNSFKITKNGIYMLSATLDCRGTMPNNIGFGSKIKYLSLDGKYLEKLLASQTTLVSANGEAINISSPFYVSSETYIRILMIHSQNLSSSRIHIRLARVL